MSGYLHFERTGVVLADAIFEALERAGNLFHHTSQWTDGWPNDNDPSPSDAIANAVKAVAEALAQYDADRRSPPVAPPAPPGGASGADGASLRARLVEALRAVPGICDLCEVRWDHEDRASLGCEPKRRHFYVPDYEAMADEALRALASPPPDPATREEPLGAPLGEYPRDARVRGEEH